MSLPCKCVRPFLNLLQSQDQLEDAVAKMDIEAFKDTVKDALYNINEAERECGVVVPEHVKRHLETAAEAARRERAITTRMRYEAEEGINDAIFELKHALEARCKP